MAKASRKPKKKNSRHYMALWLLLGPTWSAAFYFFWFSRGFLFLTKSGKNLEKTKKTRLHTPTLWHYSRLNLVFFVFLVSWVSRGFCYFGVKNKKPRDNQKTKNNKNAHPKGGAAAESWVLSFCVFCFLFFRVLSTIWKTNRSGRFVKKNIFL